MKWDCDIIQDLIPSYVDEVCSDRSKAAVEEHIGECRTCKNLVEQYRMTDFSADKLEERELNGLKKIRSCMKRQTIISYVLGILLLLLGGHAFWGYRYTAQMVYYLLLPVCMLGVYHTGEQGSAHMRAQKADHALAAGAVIALVASVCVLGVALTQALAGNAVLGVKPEKAGPTLAGIWGCCFSLQLVLFAVLWLRQRGKHIENRFRLCICITGMFLLLVYVEALRNLDSIEYVKRNFVQMSAVVLALGTAGTLICFWLSKKERNKDVRSDGYGKRR